MNRKADSDGKRAVNIPRAVLLVSTLLLGIVGWCFLLPKEPTYQGKAVSDWFDEFVSPNYPTPGRYRIVYHSSKRFIVNDTTGESLHDPAWDALQALGPEAVPYLASQLHFGMADQATYVQVYTNFPKVIRYRLPSPWERNMRRQKAVEALGEFGIHAQGAVPDLIEALKQSDLFLRSKIIRALRKLELEHDAIMEICAKLTAEGRYADMVDIVPEFGWDGSGTAHLLGEALQCPDSAVRRKAIVRLERAGTDAAPALDPIISALADSDAEIRYLAARSLEAIGTNTPTVMHALRGALVDESTLVQNVARRTLLKLAPDSIQSPSPELESDNE